MGSIFHDDINSKTLNIFCWNDLSKDCSINDSIFFNPIEPTEINTLIKNIHIMFLHLINML